MRSSKRQRREVIEIAEYKAEHAEFSKLPLSYQRAALFYGFVANDVSAFRRLLIISINTALAVRERPVLYRSYANAQTFSILRVLAGKTLEAWDAINKQIDGVQPMRDLRDDIERHAPGMHRTCSKYFKKENAIKQIRHGFAFHMDPSHWAGETSVDIDASVGLQCFVRDGANSLYSTSESLLLLQIMARPGHRIRIHENKAGTVSHIQQFEEEWGKIVDEISRYGGLVIAICDAIVLSLIEKAEEIGVAFTQTRHVVRDASPIDGVRIPVFTTPSGQGGTRE